MVAPDFTSLTRMWLRLGGVLMIWLLLSLLGIGAAAGGGGGSKAVSNTETTDTNVTPTHEDHTHGNGKVLGASDTREETPPSTTKIPSDGHNGGDHTPQDGHDGHSGGDHGMEAPPPLPLTAQEIEQFVAMVRSAPEMHVHDHAGPLLSEHMAVLDLVARADATHIAVSNGSWFDPNTWHNGEVPDADSATLIPYGVHVDYDDEADTRLFTLRVDGHLDFATDLDTKIVVDTLVVSPSGTLTIGTADMPVEDDVNVEIVIANNGAIDTDWDPGLFSRGIISHGKVDIYGQVKDSHEKVVEDPMAGDTSVTFGTLPEGWQVGDTIVVAGTNFDGYEYDVNTTASPYQGTQDEVRIISEIDGNTVYFEDALEFDHDTPRADLHTSVANYSRNVTIRSEDGDESEVFERGHVMLMHSDDVDVRYAAFLELGRTDKSQELFGTGETAGASDDDIVFNTNVGGRYSLHLHRTGVDDLDNPSILEGNAVFGSPGWGYVHHDSNALMENNASFDTFGAGYVAETGNETGAWNDNIAINAQGVSWGLAKGVNNSQEFDIGKTGDGFWFSGRMVEASNNVAASVNHGFIYFHRGPNGGDDNRPLEFDSDIFAFPEVLTYDDAVRSGATPILVANGNEVFASHIGLHVVKASPAQGHDIHSVIDDFTAWNIVVGADLEYTAHYLLNDFDLIAREGDVLGNVKEGIVFGNNTFDMVIANSSVDGFQNGIDLKKLWTENIGDNLPDDHDFVLVNTSVTNSTRDDYVNVDPNLDLILNGPITIIDDPFITLDGPLIYSPDGPDANTISISGTKTDSLGTSDFPKSADNYDLDNKEVTRLLEENGYYTTEDGTAYMVVNIYFSDGLTGDIYKQSELAEIDDRYPLGNQYHPWKDAQFNGETTLAELEEMVEGGATLVRAAEDLKQQSIENYEASANGDSASDMANHAHMLMSALTNGQGNYSEQPSNQAEEEEDSHADHMVH